MPPCQLLTRGFESNPGAILLKPIAVNGRLLFLPDLVVREVALYPRQYTSQTDAAHERGAGRELGRTCSEVDLAGLECTGGPSVTSHSLGSRSSGSQRVIQHLDKGRAVQGVGLAFIPLDELLHLPAD